MVKYMEEKNNRESRNHDLDQSNHGHVFNLLTFLNLIFIEPLCVLLNLRLNIKESRVLITVHEHREKFHKDSFKPIISYLNYIVKNES